MDPNDFVYSDEEEEEEIDWEPAGAGVGSDESSVYEDQEENDADDDEERVLGETNDEPEPDQEDRQETDLTAIDWKRVSDELLNNQNQQENENSKTTRKRLTTRDRKRLLALHQVHLLTLVAPVRQWNRLGQDRLVQALMVSLVISDSSTNAQLHLQPQHRFDFMDVNLRNNHLSHWLQQLVRWFHSRFALVLPDASRHQRHLEEEEDESLVDSLVAHDPQETALDRDVESDHHELTRERLMQTFYDRKGRFLELVLLFVALCRGLGVDTRCTCALDAIQLNKTKQNIMENALATSRCGCHGKRPSQRPSRRRRKRPRTKASLAEEETKEQDHDEEGEEVDPEQWVPDKLVTDPIGQWRDFPWIWVEVLDIKSMQWISVDVIRKVVDDALHFEQIRGRTARLSYIVSLDDHGTITDVTARYVDRWSVCRKLRLAEKWWRDLLVAFNTQEAVHQGTTATRTTTTTTTTTIIPAGEHEQQRVEQMRQEMRKKEQESLRALEDQEAMPTSLAAFKKHHLYCLESDLGQFEAIYPRKPVGIFKGKPVFLRAHVVQLKPRWKWKREGRDVREEELSKPYKTRSSKSKSTRNRQIQDVDEGVDEDDDNDQDHTNKSQRGQGLASLDPDDPTQFARLLYGEWQTRVFVPAPVVDGRVPKNKYGNIELWCDAFLPHGSRHLRLPRVQQLAKQLGVDYAPAMVGYEVKQGQSFPRFDGIIVAEENVELLQEAHAAIQQQTIEKAIDTNRQLVYKRWTKLVKRLLLRQRLNEDYGHVRAR